ncbi:MAG: DUF2147 domain-containing protein [Bacteroidales bacterium]|jgi:uncharacterized protein (DUF2147 family)|nr:DUF2147 domain-containing protein [Bacteroidales bacterium]
MQNTKKKINRTELLILFIISGLSLSAGLKVRQGDEILGSWLLPDNLEIEIFKRGDKYYGKIIDVYGFNDGQEKDIHNPDQLKRNDRLVGKVIISGLEYDQKSGEWINGTIYAPHKGITLDLTIIEINGRSLEAKGSKLFFSKTIIWKRI